MTVYTSLQTGIISLYLAIITCRIVNVNRFPRAATTRSHTKRANGSLKLNQLILVADLAAIRQLLESETGGTNCPSCNMPFDKGKKRKLIDTCGHERCYACMFRNEACPICARNSQGRRPAMERYTPSPQRQDDWQSPMRLPKPPKQPTNLVQSCPTPPHTRRRFFLSPKSLRSPFAQRASRHSSENHVPLSGKHYRTPSLHLHSGGLARGSRRFASPLRNLRTQHTLLH